MVILNYQTEVMYILFIHIDKESLVDCSRVKLRDVNTCNNCRGFNVSTAREPQSAAGSALREPNGYTEPALHRFREKAKMRR